MTRNPVYGQGNFQGGERPNYSEQPQYDNNEQSYGTAMYGQAPPQQPYEQYNPQYNATGPSYYSSNDQPYQQYPPQSRHDIYAGPPRYGNEDYQQPAPIPPYQGYGSASSFSQNAQTWGGQTDNFRSHFEQPHDPLGSNQDMSGTFPAQPDPTDRGIMGALGGAAAGGYAGHKVHHGILGGVGGAIAGSMLEDAYKKKHNSSHNSNSALDVSHDESQRHKYGHAAGPGVMAGNFHASARNVRLEGHSTLVAEVMDMHGHHQYSTIDLNDCFTNDGGVLKWARGGSFAATARDVRLEEGGSVMTAELGDGRGGWQWNSVHLNERISNDNGRLVVL